MMYPSTAPCGLTYRGTARRSRGSTCFNSEPHSRCTFPQVRSSRLRQSAISAFFATCRFRHKKGETAMKRVTLASLEQILREAGFTASKTPGVRIWFHHPDPDTRILLPPFRDDELVDLNNIAAIRRYLDFKGLMDQDRFDELLRERSLVG